MSCGCVHTSTRTDAGSISATPGSPAIAAARLLRSPGARELEDHFAAPVPAPCRCLLTMRPPRRKQAQVPRPDTAPSPTAMPNAAAFPRSALHDLRTGPLLVRSTATASLVAPI